MKELDIYLLTKSGQKRRQMKRTNWKEVVRGVNRIIKDRFFTVKVNKVTNRLKALTL